MSEEQKHAFIDAAPLTCLECHCHWVNPRERWRMYVTFDSETGLFCPTCSAHEFGAYRD